MSTTAKITFSRAGKLQITKPAVALMGLKKRDKISLAQNEEGFWYIFKDSNGFAFEESAAGAFFLVHPGLVKEYLATYDLDLSQGYKAFLANDAEVHRGSEYWLMDLSQDETIEE